MQEPLQELCGFADLPTIDLGIDSKAQAEAQPMKLARSHAAEFFLGSSPKVVELHLYFLRLFCEEIMLSSAS